MAEVQFAGETFRTADSVPLFALMRLASIAKAGVDTRTMEGLAALYDMLEQLVAPQEWEKFQQAALRIRATDEDLLKFLTAVYSKAKPPVEAQGAEVAAEPVPATMWN